MLTTCRVLLALSALAVADIHAIDMSSAADPRAAELLPSFGNRFPSRN